MEPEIKPRNPYVEEHIKKQGAGAGTHANPNWEVKKGTRRKPKHPKPLDQE